MSLILQLETATATCSVALTDGGKILALREIAEPNAHGTVLTGFIRDVLESAGKTERDLAAIAVSRGPGSYTGLRIGVSVAKGLCFALDVPLLAVDTLEAMAAGLRMREDFAAGTRLCPMIDARRMEVYTAVYDLDLNVVRPVAALVVEPESFHDLSDRPLIFFGDGSAKCREPLAGTDTVFIEGFHNSAGDMSGLAAAKYQAGAFEDLAYFEPYYLKEFLFRKA